MQSYLQKNKFQQQILLYFVEKIISWYDAVRYQFNRWLYKTQ